MSGSSGDEAAQILTTFLDGMPTPKERLNAAICALLDERGRRYAGTNLGAGSSQMGPGDEAAGRTAAAWEVDAYATRYSAYASGRSDADPGWPPVEAMHTVVAELVAATARAKQAEAEVERLREANRTLARFSLRMGVRVDEQQDDRRQPHEPIRDQQDVDDLAAAPEDRLSPEEAAEFLKNIAECRGGEEGGNHGDA